MAVLALSVLAITSGFAVGQPVLSGALPCEEPVAVRQPQLSPAIAMAVAAARDIGMIVDAPGPESLLPAPALRHGRETAPIGMSVEVTAAPVRFTDMGANGALSRGATPMEFSVAAPTSLNVDVGFARRRVDSETPGAYVTGSGSEVRIGQGLAKALEGKDIDRHGWYLFAASDGRALTWTPSNNPARADRGMRLENAVEIGDIQAGVAMSAGALKTSLSVVKRTVKNWIGPYKTEADESFAGLTLSYKR